MLLGRERELAAIDALLGHVHAGGGALLVRGEAGLGKSALLDEAQARARELGMTILRTAGVPSETRMAFAGLHRLLLAYMTKVPQLPRAHADSLSAAFGLHENGGPPDLFRVALAALELLADVAAEAPLLVLVEDAHWLDADTADVLAFVARRLEEEPIVLLLASRDGHRTPLDDARLPETALVPLRERESVALLNAHAPQLTPAARRRVLDTARGNPLALLELPSALANGHAGEPIAISDAVMQAFLERVNDLPPLTRTALLVAALDDGGGLPEILAAASALTGQPVTAADLAPAEAAKLLAPGDGGLHFRHPLVSAAVSQAAPTATRRAAHAALADAHAGDPERSVWHRAAACSGPDAEVATALEQAGLRALRRGAPTVAAAALQRAAELTADPAARGPLLLEAAETEFELGRSDLALRLLAQARPLELGERDQARLALLFEAADEDSWSGPDRVRAFAEIATGIAGAEEPERALQGLLAVARSCWWGNATQPTRDLVVAAAERLPLSCDSPALLAVLGCTDPVRRGAVVNERLTQIRADAAADPRAMHLIGTAATTVWAFDTSLRFLAVAVEGLRAQGRLGLLAQALVSQAWAALHVAKISLAVSTAEEAGKLARETGQSRWAVAADLVQATVAGERAEFERAERLTDQAEAELLPIGAQGMLALVQFARGRGAVAHLRYEEGYEHLRRILDPGDIAYHPFVGSWALGDLIEAAMGSGHGEEAHWHFAELERLAQVTNGPMLRALVAYTRPLLSRDELADPLYRKALQGHLGHWPCYRTRMLLAYGRWLRRQRRVNDSRAPLRAAREGADALGLPGLAESARQELRASGERSATRAAEAWDELTPQELQIAQLVTEGLSNREIGERLYLSHRTVGSHLYRIFPKLGVSSRAQIVQALAPLSENST